MEEIEISIVSPVYMAEDLVSQLVNEIITAVSEITNQFEIILVEDGSSDGSWGQIMKCCQRDPRIKGLKLSRNFGQHNAIMAGLEGSIGEWTVVMDCDLQDNPREIKRLYHATRSGSEVVLARRKSRQDSGLKRFSSRIFYAVLGYMTDTSQDSAVANFGIYRRTVVQAILSMHDREKYLPTMSQWVGFTSVKVDVEHQARAAGDSTYSLRKLVNLALSNIISFSDKPLWIMVKLGFTISGLSFLAGLVVVFRYLRGSITEPGYASIFVSIWFIGGMLMLMLGIVGIYVGKTFDQSKGRPNYIVSKKLNFLDPTDQLKGHG